MVVLLVSVVLEVDTVVLNNVLKVVVVLIVVNAPVPVVLLVLLFVPNKVSYAVVVL